MVVTKWCHKVTEKLEARLQELEEQIRNQQRDLHTLCKNYVTSLPRSGRGQTKKKAKALKNGYWGACCAHLDLAQLIGPGVETITAAFYHLIGLMVAG